MPLYHNIPDRPLPSPSMEVPQPLPQQKSADNASSSTTTNPSKVLGPGRSCPCNACQSLLAANASISELEANCWFVNFRAQNVQRKEQKEGDVTPRSLKARQAEAQLAQLESDWAAKKAAYAQAAPIAPQKELKQERITPRKERRRQLLARKEQLEAEWASNGVADATKAQNAKVAAEINARRRAPMPSREVPPMSTPNPTAAQRAAEWVAKTMRVPAETKRPSSPSSTAAQRSKSPEPVQPSSAKLLPAEPIKAGYSKSQCSPTGSSSTTTEPQTADPLTALLESALGHSIAVERAYWRVRLGQRVQNLAYEMRLRECEIKKLLRVKRGCSVNEYERMWRDERARVRSILGFGEVLGKAEVFEVGEMEFHEMYFGEGEVWEVVEVDEELGRWELVSKADC
ncbi:hypothetical protein EK21DRAFT_106065 [Setomelanomma holmii]|uniref:Uncharacterized protein n=1 Tax=Setomelanomma holmii TaxID=210430 RepID=A0A9P4LSS9_9PLEO|nr:hypothetical protein EK21DRAFT_106065 [Setomelanomma holmii]